MPIKTTEIAAKLKTLLSYHQLHIFALMTKNMNTRMVGLCCITDRFGGSFYQIHRLHFQSKIASKSLLGFVISVTAVAPDHQWWR